MFSVPRVIFFPKPLCLFLRKLRGKAENVVLKMFLRKTELPFKILCHIEWKKVRRAEKETEVIRTLAQKESCVIVGRLANYILKDRPGAYHVFISADTATEAARVAERDRISVDEAAAKVKKVNHERAVHCKHFTKTDWGNVKNYNLCIKSDDFGVEDTAKIIRELFQKKMGV